MPHATCYWRDYLSPYVQWRSLCSPGLLFLLVPRAENSRIVCRMFSMECQCLWSLLSGSLARVMVQQHKTCLVKHLVDLWTILRTGYGLFKKNQSFYYCILNLTKFWKARRCWDSGHSSLLVPKALTCSDHHSSHIPSIIFPSPTRKHVLKY